jgi:AcrR family transcriptional regulator
MPKIVDHDRRDEIALIACRVVAEHGFEKASMVRIARGAGYTTGMLAHYFGSKQDIIIAALRLMRGAPRAPERDLGIRDIMGYCVIALLIGLVTFGGALLGFA